MLDGKFDVGLCLRQILDSPRVGNCDTLKEMVDFLQKQEKGKKKRSLKKILKELEDEGISVTSGGNQDDAVCN